MTYCLPFIVCFALAELITLFDSFKSVVYFDFSNCFLSVKTILLKEGYEFKSCWLTLLGLGAKSAGIKPSGCWIQYMSHALCISGWKHTKWIWFHLLVCLLFTSSQKQDCVVIFVLMPEEHRPFGAALWSDVQLVLFQVDENEGFQVTGGWSFLSV